MTAKLGVNTSKKAMFREISDDFQWELSRAIKHYLKHESGPDWELTRGVLETPLAAVKYLSENFLSKYNDNLQGNSPIERRNAAIVKWLGVELRNQRTNQRIVSTNPSFNLGRGYNDKDRNTRVQPPSTTAWDLLFRARGIVARVLGTCPEGSDLTTFLLEGGGFTSGASTSKRRSLDTLARKYTERMDATPAVLSLIHPSCFAEVFEGWTTGTGLENFSPRLVKGNILFTVPKNAEIDRVACKEPDLNLFCQKAVGNHIRRRLRLFGVNLNDQTRNQTLAKRAYSSALSTIDLSSASDSLSTELVRQLVSPDWYTVLMSLRSPKTFIDGRSHANAMISSMGNGYTFELESLVFYSLVRALQLEFDESAGIESPLTTTVGVFGDDLIIDRRHARPLISFLGWCGFKVNAKKTFIEGALFESCGKHYYCGHDVSPFFLRRPFADVSDLILALNQLRSWMIRTEIDLYEHVNNTVVHGFYEIWLKFKKLVPRSLHGGWDLESRVCLVSMGPSRCRLEPEMRHVKKVSHNYQNGMMWARLHDEGFLDKVSVTPLSEQFFETVRHTDEFPEKWTGKWLIRRFRDPNRFFGICTAPLHQEMG